MNQPFVSIIIATYNRARYISKAIESIKAESDQDWELIIVDDGSVDDTKTILEPFLADQRIVYEQLPHNKGATYARNYGIAKAKGVWILVWDSDDILYPHAFSVIHTFAAQHPLVSIFSAPAKAIRKGKEEAYPHLETGILTLEDIVCRRLPQNSKARFAKRELFSQVHYVSKNVDFLVNVGLAERGVWFHINEYLGELRIEDDAVSLTKARKKFKKNLSIERSFLLITFLDRHRDTLIQRCPELYAAYCYGASVGQFFAKEYRKAKMLSKESLAHVFSLKAFGIFIAATFLSLFTRK
jgi:glycosyltransferase involved in cell wall biosynthesis